ncbi:MAG: hypothetical protein AB7I48_20370 [Planctomycetaceae bacterium]
MFGLAAVFQATAILAIDLAAGPDRGALRADIAGIPFRLPRDMNTPVVTMTFTDPRSASLPPTAELTIFADGRVAVTTETYSRQVVSARLPPGEWLKVQRVLFAENDLLACDSQLLNETIRTLRRHRRRPEPGPEAAVTIITMRGENVANEVRCQAVGLTATQLPDLPEIQRVFACQQCLQNVVHVVRAGGYEQVHQTLETVNTRLQRQLPGCDPLSPDNLSLVDRQPDGTRYLQFSRLPCRGDTPSGHIPGPPPRDHYLLVSVYERPGGPLEISITGESASP